MKKLFTLVAFVLSAMSMNAESYNGTLHIQVPTMSIDVNQVSNLEAYEEDGGTYELKLTDFNFQGLKVGTIDVKGVKADTNSIFTRLSYKGTTEIQPTSDGAGMLKGQTVQLDLTGKFDKETGIFAANIAIIAGEGEEALNISVNFTNAQIPNSDFEDFHTFKPTANDAVKQTEPAYWHGFGSSMTKEGSFMDFSGMLKAYNQIEISEDVRDDEDAPTEKCVKISSVNVAGISISNGTLTTGRLQAGSVTATSTANCAFLDLTNTDKDELGNPFYTTLTTIPDAVNLWVKFKRGGAASDYEIKKGFIGTGKYSTTASVKAVITDGTYYQDPEAEEYSSVIGIAKDATIDTNNGEWQNLTIPFDYSKAKEDAKPKAILVNITTNAYPGIGSKNASSPDELYVDDLSLVYNAGLKSVKFKGVEQEIVKVKDQTLVTINNAGEYSVEDFEVESDGAGAYVSYAVEHVYDPDFEEYGDELHINIVSADLQKENNYVVTINGGTLTGINHTKANLPNGIKAIYNLAGQQVSSMTSGNVYIVKTTDGKTKKVIKK